MPGLYRLTGTVKNYEWGGFHFIPGLLLQDNKTLTPFAEYWMGVHPLGMSRIDTGGSIANDLSLLAPDLPFLFKVLDVREMLSIQVHPNKEDAVAGYVRENEEGIPLDAPNRCYKDANHKPELMVALGDFWLLHGFKSSEELTDTLLNVQELRELLPVFQQAGYEGLYKHVMELNQEEVNRILTPLLANLKNQSQSAGNNMYSEDYWALKAAEKYTQNGNIDRGIFSIYFFNIVHLKKGEAIFQGAGVPHAYLKGQNVEIMANSDNVLRGGLTTKHIDVKELLKHVKCGAVWPQIFSPEVNEEGEKIFDTPVTDFRLSMFEMKKGDVVSFEPKGTEIVLLTEGVVEIDNDKDTLLLKKGTPAAVVFAGDNVYLAAAEDSLVFRASAGFHNG